MLLCRSYFDDETFSELEADPEFQAHMRVSQGYLHVDQWPYRLIRLGDQAEAPSALENLYASLRVKLESMQAEAIANNSTYALGYKALEVWSEGLLDHPWYAAADEEAFSRRLSVNHFCMMALADARRCAASYLRDSLPLVHDPQQHAALEEMSAIYGEMAALLDKYYKEMSDPSILRTTGAAPRASWTTRQRELQAELLGKVASLEHQGDTLAQTVLSLA